MFLRVIRALGWAVFWLVLFVLICPAVVIGVQVLDQLPAAIQQSRDALIPLRMRSIPAR
jgi:hypothetical protein